MHYEDRVLGGVLGVILGDALGLPVQFWERAEIKKNPITGMRGYGTFNYPPGTWSDDGSLTLCLVESLCQAGYDLHDQAQRFLRWYRNGYWTPFGESFDIGRTTAQAMERLAQGINPLEAGPADERSNGNGSLMRILPAVLYFCGEAETEMLRKVMDVSKVTHGHPRSQLACGLYALLAKELLDGREPFQAYEVMRQKAGTAFADSDLAGELESFTRILNRALPNLSEDEIKSSGYVVDTLEAAIWCLLKNNNFKDTLLAAVNLGDDTDTVGAVTGGLAGVCYGLSNIPQEWVHVLIRSSDILFLARRFAEIIEKSK